MAHYGKGGPARGIVIEPIDPPWDNHRVLRSSEGRIAAIVDHPHELLAYQRWLDDQREAAEASKDAERDYLFSRECPRFEPRKDDVVVAMPGLSAKKRGGGCRLVADGVDLSLKSVPAGPAQALLDAMDGERCLLEARWTAGVDAALLGRFLRGTFGLVVFAPHAASRLEARMSGAQIVRFPTAPYAIERPYWENMIAVRDRYARATGSSDEVLTDPDRFVALLRELHVISLMGETLESFYKPASPIADRVVAPGRFYEAAPRLMETTSGNVYLDGPRVKVPWLGGESYHRALARDLGDPSSLEPSRTFTRDGLDWGQVVTARSERDDEPVAMFLPPRPLTPGHVEVLRQALLEAERSIDRPDAALAACARFHRAWVQLHPFHCANQSLAMNLVNAVLERSHGAGIPHLVLDHLALRLSDEAYEEAFRRAVAGFAVSEDDPARRLAMLDERKRRSFAVIEAFGAGATLEEASASDPDGARWALVHA
jgi:hypothetical protein